MPRMGILLMLFCLPHVKLELYFIVGVGDEMSALRKPNSKWRGWLIAVVYMLGCLNPSFAVASRPDPVGLSVQCNHVTVQNSPNQQQHGHAGAEATVFGHDAFSEDGSACRDQCPDRHVTCCDSAACCGAISPEAISLLQFEHLQSRCGPKPDSPLAGKVLGPLYRPPIA